MMSIGVADVSRSLTNEGDADDSDDEGLDVAMNTQ